MHSTGRFTCHKPLFRNHPEFVYQQSDHNWLIHTLIIFNLFMVLLEVYLLASFILNCAFEAFINLPGISKISLFLPLRCESPRSFGPSKPWRLRSQRSFGAKPQGPAKSRAKTPKVRKRVLEVCGDGSCTFFDILFDAGCLWCLMNVGWKRIFFQNYPVMLSLRPQII